MPKLYSKDQIKKHLKEDPTWELPADASLEDWENYDEAWDELEEAGEVKLTGAEDEDSFDLEDDWEEN